MRGDDRTQHSRLRFAPSAGEPESGPTAAIFIFGVVLAVLANRTGSLVAPIAAHAVYNACLVIASLRRSDPDAARTADLTTRPTPAITPPCNYRTRLLALSCSVPCGSIHELSKITCARRSRSAGGSRSLLAVNIPSVGYAR